MQHVWYTFSSELCTDGVDRTREYALACANTQHAVVIDLEQDRTEHTHEETAGDRDCPGACCHLLGGASVGTTSSTAYALTPGTKGSSCRSAGGDAGHEGHDIGTLSRRRHGTLSAKQVDR